MKILKNLPNILRRGRNGFTLAEVLVTLAVIGVVASLTIPALIQNTNKQQYAVRAKTAFSTISQATSQLVADNGGGLTGNCFNGEDDQQVFNCYKSKLQIIKECGVDSGCFKNAEVKWLSGVSVPSYNIDGSHSLYKAILKNGISIAINDYAGDCISNSGTGQLNQTCAQITIDVDGPNKGEHTWGRDIFSIILTSTGALPNGTCGYIDPSGDCNYALSCSPSADTGYGCLARILKEGSMNY